MNAGSAAFALAGIAVVVVTAHDLLRTVLTVDGGGPVTGRLASLAWQLAVRLHARDARHDRLAAMGPALAVATLLCWLGGLWLGWTLIFCADPQAVVTAKDGVPASFAERIYFVGYTLTTLGLGDYRPDTTTWRMATVLAAASGLMLFTMAITYIVPIVTASATLRQLATYLDGLGDDGPDIVVRSWEHDRGFDALRTHLNAVMPLVATARQLYLAYPILHYFHSTDVRAALPVRLATLDEAVTILAHGVAPGARLPVQVIGPLRAQLNGFLSTLHAQWIEPAWPAPAAPSLAPCRAAGIPTASDADFEDALYERTGHRARLRGLVQSDGWTWEAVAGGGARKAAPDDRC